MTKLTKSQLASYRLLRDKGLPAAEARRVAKLSYAKLADEVSRRLRARTAEAQSATA